MNAMRYKGYAVRIKFDGRDSVVIGSTFQREITRLTFSLSRVSVGSANSSASTRRIMRQDVARRSLRCGSLRAAGAVRAVDTS